MLDRKIANGPWPVAEKNVSKGVTISFAANCLGNPRNPGANLERNPEETNFPFASITSN